MLWLYNMDRELAARHWLEHGRCLTTRHKYTRKHKGQFVSLKLHLSCLKLLNGFRLNLLPEINRRVVNTIIFSGNTFVVQNILHVSVVFQKAIIRHRLKNIRKKNKQVFTLWDVTFRTACPSHLQGLSSPKNWNDRLSRNVGNYHSSLRNIPDKRRTNLHCGGSLKSCRKQEFYIQSY